MTVSPRTQISPAVPRGTALPSSSRISKEMSGVGRPQDASRVSSRLPSGAKSSAHRISAMVPGDSVWPYAAVSTGPKTSMACLSRSTDIGAEAWIR
jgi:hypothetical protein